MDSRHTGYNSQNGKEGRVNRQGLLYFNLKTDTDLL